MSNLDPVNFPIIAGAASGIRVRVNPATKMPFARLKVFAKQGNHWARTCVQAMESLSSGQFKDFVYTPQPGKLPMFTMLLPGCKVECAKLSNSEFIIYSIQVDGSYFALQKSYDKPGLFSVKKESDKWKATLVQDGNIAKTEYRVVAITDKYKNIDDATNASGRGICRFSGPQELAKRFGYDMHYTNGTGKIRGLTKLQKSNAETDPHLLESAQLLATTMTAAQDVKHVNWVSEGGGSGVLTQAMRILKEQRVNFRGKDHYVMFSGPTTNLVKAQNLAMDIGMGFEGSGRKIDYLNIQEVLGSGIGGAAIAEYYRFRKDPEYSILDAGKSLVADKSAAEAAFGVLRVSALAITGAVGFTAVVPVSGVVGAAGVVLTCVGLGHTLAKSWLPRIFGDKL